MTLIALLLLESNTYLDLDPKAEISLNGINPIFDRDTIDRTWTYPFKLPDTDHNRMALGFPNRLDTVSSKAKIPCRLEVAGLPGPTGILKIKKGSSGQIEAVFQNETLDASQTLDKLELTDLIQPVQITSPYCADTYLEIGSPASQAQYWILQINETIFQVPAHEYQQLLDAIQLVYPGLVSDPGLNDFPYYTILVNCAEAPQEGLRITLNPPRDNPADYETFGIIDTGNIPAEAQRLNDALVAAIQAGGTDDVAFPVVHLPSLYDEKNPSYQGYANYVRPDGIHPNDPTVPIADEGFPHTVIPMPFLTKIIYAIGSQVGRNFELQTGNESEIDQLIVWQNRPIDFLPSYAFYVVDAPDFAERHTYLGEVQLGQLVPKLTALELLQRFSSTFNLYLAEEEGKLTFRAIRDQLRAEPIEWTDKVEFGHGIVYAPLEGYTLDYDRPDGDNAIEGQLERIDGGAEASPYIAGFYSMYNRYEVDPINEERSWLIPSCEETASSSFFDLSNNATPRLLFYRGLQSDSQGNSYGLATYGKRNYQGILVGNLSLDWSDPGGLFETWWADYILLLQHGRTVTMQLRLTIQDIFQVLEWKSVRRQIVTPRGTMVGVIREIRVKISPSRIGLATITFQLEP